MLQSCYKMLPHWKEAAVPQNLRSSMPLFLHQMKFLALLFSLSLAAASPTADNSILDKRRFGTSFLTKLHLPNKGSNGKPTSFFAATRPETGAAKKLISSWKRAEKKWQDANFALIRKKENAKAGKVFTQEEIQVKHLEDIAISLDPWAQIKTLTNQADSMRLQAKNLDKKFQELLNQRANVPDKSLGSQQLETAQLMAKKLRMEANKKILIAKELKRLDDIEQEKLLGMIQ